MPFFERLETTGLASWVGESLWGYPIVLGMHAIGLAIVVGIFVLLDLRILGILRGVSLKGLWRLFPLAWTGFLINALSGTALFTSQATTFVDSKPFLIKISSVFAGVIVGMFMQRRLSARVAAWENAGETMQTPDKALAAVSLICWISAIFAGRLIAYL